MKRVLKIILRIILWIAIAILLLIFLFNLMFWQPPSWLIGKKCVEGPLEKIETCDEKHASSSWMNSGWWYSDANGVLKSSYQSLPEKTSEPIQVTPTQSVVSIACEVVLGTASADHNCYASQRLPSNGNTRYFTVLIVEKETKKARFFEGSQYVLTQGRPIYFGHEAYPNFPDLSPKQGKKR